VTREELHALVWSEPLRNVARSMGISDVALAKRCRKEQVPVPPRGWWARKQAGKRAEVAPLPPLPFAMRNYFPAIDRTAGEPIDGDEASPGPPVFRDIATVTLEIQAAVAKLKAPATLARPHPVVARLLKQDEARKATPSAGGYFSDYYGPKFASPIQQRRLRILSCILVELGRLGCKVHGSTHAGERFSVSVGGHWTNILFGVEGGRSHTPFHRGRGHVAAGDRERLRFDLVDHDDRTPPARSWRETERPLEQQATDIVCGLLLRVEEEARKGALWWHRYQIEERARKAREAKLAAEKAEAERIAREHAMAAARIKMLTDGADALEQAARIRRYVEAVRAESAARPSGISSEALAAWASWALAEADRIDPVVSGRFISDLAAAEHSA
jgi:hypothetical protein